MTIGGVGLRSKMMVQSLLSARSELANLERQLGTGKKSDNYAGLGLDRGLTVGLRSHLSALGAYADTITQVGLRLELAQSSLSRIADIGRDVKGATAPASSAGPNVTQQIAVNSLGEIFSLLNTRAGDRYLFSGLASDKPAVDSYDNIMNGDGQRAGFKQIVEERRQADLGADGLGRLAVDTPTPTSVSLVEDVAGSPFGFKLTGISTSVTGAAVSGPAGAPPAMDIDFNGSAPEPGQTVRVTLSLPDGSSETLTLTATASTTPAAGEFSIGGTDDATAANFETALTAALEKAAGTALTAASALAAANDFFDMDDANPPQRVAGPPFDSATALIDGTSANTVIWYTGEAGSAPARSTATARADQTISVNYGSRANEEGIRWQIQQIAALAAVTISATDPNAAALGQALNDRVRQALDVPSGVQRIDAIQAELAGAQSTLQSAKERHQQTKASLSDLLGRVEGVSNEEVAAQILAMQTKLQASLQVTAMLYQTSILKYI